MRELSDTLLTHLCLPLAVYHPSMMNETPKSAMPLSSTSPDTVPHGSQANTHMPRGSVPSGARPPPSFPPPPPLAPGVSPQEKDPKDRVIKALASTSMKAQHDLKRKVAIPSFDLSGSSSDEE